MSPDTKAASPAKKDAPAPTSVKEGAHAAPAAGEKKHASDAKAPKDAHKDDKASSAKAKDAKAPKDAKAKASKGPKIKPTLSEDQKDALAVRAEKKARQPAFRRHEWWRYKRLGGKHASWRLPRGVHSKTRRHFGYRPPVPSIGYRAAEVTRGLHPSGFAEVLVHNVDDLGALDKASQAARVGGTVGGRKQEQIEKKAAQLGIRILNPRREA